MNTRQVLARLQDDLQMIVPRAMVKILVDTRYGPVNIKKRSETGRLNFDESEYQQIRKILSEKLKDKNDGNLTW